MHDFGAYLCRDHHAFELDEFYALRRSSRLLNETGLANTVRRTPRRSCHAKEPEAVGAPP